MQKIRNKNLTGILFELEFLVAGGHQKVDNDDLLPGKGDKQGAANGEKNGRLQDGRFYHQTEGSQKLFVCFKFVIQMSVE